MNERNAWLKGADFRHSVSPILIGFYERLLWRLVATHNGRSATTAWRALAMS
jgi:hypothetical protein